MRDNPLLTIAIPTFNRINDLKISLLSLLSQLHELELGSDAVELIVSDNASTDGTLEFIKDINQNKKIIYHRNEKNLGPDGNMSLCYKYASGRFIWIFSDDDFLATGTLNKILNLLNNNPDIGNCYINSVWGSGPQSLDFYGQTELTYSKYNSQEQLKAVNYWLTFLTGNIVNKTILGSELLNSLPNGTSLIQLGWTIPSVFATGKNLYIHDKIIYCKVREERGYSIIPIFCTNFNKILTDFEKTQKDKNILNTVLPLLIEGFIYPEIDNMIKNNETVVLPMAKVFWNNDFLWKRFLPSYIKRKSKSIFRLNNL